MKKMFNFIALDKIELNQRNILYANKSVPNSKLSNIFNQNDKQIKMDNLIGFGLALTVSFSFSLFKYLNR